MKKIMFNDRYGLTQAVLDGRKTITRRIITNETAIAHCEKGYTELALNYAAYHVGDVVAIAQRYYDIEDDNYRKNIDEQIKRNPRLKRFYIHDGHLNKMYVKAELMPHHIRITNIRVERLQDISDKDCLKEGIKTAIAGTYGFIKTTQKGKSILLFNTPKQAFHTLIDKVSGKGTWDSNPWVFVYEFEIIN